MRCVLLLLCLSLIPLTASAEPGPRFTKLDPAGAPLAESAADWACVADAASGLMWEAKSERGLRARDNTYSWFDPRAAVPGARDGGVCTGSRCDTAGYAEAVNQARLCGHGDWRLPDESELFTLFVAPARVDGQFFGDSARASYWSSSSGPQDTAWFVAFYGRGISYHHSKAQAKRVRLVRGSFQPRF